MNYVIDLLAAVILLFCFLSGWHKGFRLSALGVVRVIIAYGGAWLAGRYLGYWLGEIAHRPRIVTVPVIAGLTFIILTFIFHVVMTELRDELKEKQKSDDFQLPWYSSLGGGGINLFAGILSMVLLLWLGDLFMVGVSGQSLPGLDRSHFGRFTRRTVYESVNLVTARDGRESQAASMARVISNPAIGMQHLRNVFEAESVKQLLSDEQFAEDLLSGEPEKIQQNTSFQQFVQDSETIDELLELGLLSKRGSPRSLSEKLSAFGSNEKIRESMQQLKEKGLLSPDRIKQLIRDPDFDVVIGELMK